MTTIFKRIQRARAQIAAEHGFSMIPAVTAVFVGSLISMGAWSAAHSDIGLQNQDRYTKVAYSQAESGVTDYVQHMAEDAGYWQYCDAPPGVTGSGLGQTAVNDTERSGSSGTLARRWLPSPTPNTAADAAVTAQYTIDLIPANGQPSCKAKSNRSESMVDRTTGTIRLRVTGRAGPAAPSTANVEQWRRTEWRKRSIVIEFRRKGFLDYAYFTDRESRDPVLYSAASSERTNCARYYSPASTATADNPTGRYYYDGSSGRSTCTEIQFADADVIRGPFHTNDAMLLQSNGGAMFGTDPSDVVEVFDSKCPFRTSAHAIPLGTVDTGHSTGNCPPLNGTGSVRPDRTGPIRIGAQAGYLPLPESNEDLLIYADPTNTDLDYQGYTFYGTTRIVLGTGQITVTNADINGGSPQTMAYPPSGVIYVANDTGVSDCTFDPAASYSNALEAGCGLAEVSGTYDTPLTIASQSDIVVTGNTQRATTAVTAVLGLIAQNFVRIRHYKPTSTNVNCSSGAVLNTAGTAVTELHAAVLTLQHSFTVDNYECGSKIGTLHAYGVLAQAYRGAVGTGGDSSGSGYIKNYEYDRRYKYLTPPHFLVPTLSTWRISRYREQTPACACL